MVKKIIFAVCTIGALALLLLFVIVTKKNSFEAMGEAGKLMVPMPESVSTFKTERQTWQDRLQAIGSIEPDKGVRLSAEVAGVVRAINFKNGQNVSEGDILVQLDITY